MLFFLVDNEFWIAVCATTPYWNQRNVIVGQQWVEGAGLLVWMGGPPGASFGFYHRETFQRQNHTEKVLSQWESLGSDML